jgi:hypothetical protein
MVIWSAATRRLGGTICDLTSTDIDTAEAIGQFEVLDAYVRLLRHHPLYRMGA